MDHKKACLIEEEDALGIFYMSKSGKSPSNLEGAKGGECAEQEMVGRIR